MEKAGRNDPCLCGSGKKYKNCCASNDEINLDGLPPYGLRMKGGIRYDPDEAGFFVIIHIWDNVECRGEPQEWRYPRKYTDEEEAMRYYKTHISPALIRFMETNAEKSKNATFFHRRLEE